MSMRNGRRLILFLAARVIGGSARDHPKTRALGRRGRMAYDPPTYMGHVRENSEQMWNACYGGIGYCNNTLADIQELSYDNFGLAESDKRQHIAELTALRAYFQLLLLDAFRIPRSPSRQRKRSVRLPPQENFHFIEESLLNAIPDLPKAPSKNYEGRIARSGGRIIDEALF